MIAIFKREFKSYFTNPLGFVILAIFYFFLGLNFSSSYSSGSPYIASVILGISWVLLMVVPAITMRLFSDERRQKTDQVIFTAPVKLINVVMGKFLSALALYAIGFAPTIIFEIIIASYVSVNVFHYIYALIGIMLFGAALIAIGMFLSSLTESPIISIILALVVNLFIMIAGGIAQWIPVPTADAWFKYPVKWFAEFIVTFLNGMDFITVLDSFANQTFAIKDVIYFISITAAFIFLTERSLEKRRWS